ncbi:hypothetical protein H6G64_33115 [Calothrix sp. FACHB-156]|nr:hypothetical protein [Calothrix sp. FACHB-156]
MEPVGLTATAIATLILTKAFEKTGETLGAKVLEKAGELTAQLKEKFPKVAAAIMRVEEKPLDVGKAELLDAEVAGELVALEKDAEVTKTMDELVKEAKVDPNHKLTQTIQSLENTIKSQPQATTVQNFGKLAEEIKAVFQGNTIQNQTLNF